MDLDQSLNNTLQAISPQTASADINKVAEILTQLINRTISPEQAILALSSSSVISLMKLLSGQQLPAGNALLSFGESLQAGDISFQDIAGSNIIKINININDYASTSNTKSRLPIAIHRRIEADMNQVNKFLHQNSNIKMIDAQGSPPNTYVFQYNLKGITGISSNNVPYFSDYHITEMHVHQGFPFNLPFIQFQTPIFHPNVFESGQVCLGWFCLPYSLLDIVMHIARMIDFQVYDLTSPSNQKSSKWVIENKNLLPLTNWHENTL